MVEEGYYPETAGYLTTSHGQVIYPWEAPTSYTVQGLQPGVALPDTVAAQPGYAEIAALAPMSGLGMLGAVAPAAVAAVPALAAAIPSLPGWVAPVAGVIGTGLAAYGAYQALGGGEGEGLFGMDILGGDGGQVIPGTQIPLQGWGLKEPPPGMIVKEWRKRIDSREGDFNLQFYLLQTSRGYRIAMYNTRTKMWKSWAMPKPAVIGKNMPSHRMLTRLRRNLKRHTADAKTILSVASPASYASMHGYRKYKKRRN